MEEIRTTISEGGLLLKVIGGASKSPPSEMVVLISSLTEFKHLLLILLTLLHLPMIGRGIAYAFIRCCAF
jgi:hypothetical protein